MDIKALSPDFAVSAKISVTDVAALQAQGFKSIICNLPDGENADQTNFAAINTAAEQHGLTAVYLPVPMGSQIQAEQTTTFRQAMDKLPKPVLGYCRSGMRASTLWMQAQSVQSVAVPSVVNQLAA